MQNMQNAIFTMDLLILIMAIARFVLMFVR